MLLRMISCMKGDFMATENGGDGEVLEKEEVERAGFIPQRKTKHGIIPFFFNTVSFS